MIDFNFPTFCAATFPYLEIGITCYWQKLKEVGGTSVIYLPFCMKNGYFFFKSVMEIDTDEILIINVAFVFLFVPFVSLQSASLDLIDNDTVPLSSTNDPQYG